MPYGVSIHCMSPRKGPAMQATYPLTFDVDYPNRPLNRLTTAFRIFMLIPIAIVLGTLATVSGSGSGDELAAAGAGLLVVPPLLMIVFRQKYPRWWFDWNRELMRFTNRFNAYAGLLSDSSPSTDEDQYV